MNCVFCGIVDHVIDAKIIVETDKSLAFMDINPLADGHTVIISKKHYQYFSETPIDVLQDMIALCHKVANKIAKSSLKPWGFNYLCNEGKIAGQAVMHVHMHVIPKYGKDEGFKFGLAKNRFVNPSIEDVYKKIIKVKD